MFPGALLGALRSHPRWPPTHGRKQVPPWIKGEQLRLCCPHTVKQKPPLIGGLRGRHPKPVKGCIVGGLGWEYKFTSARLGEVIVPNNFIEGAITPSAHTQ